MISENLMTIFYKELRLEYCIFENEIFYVGRYLIDTREYDVGLSLLSKYNISKIIFSNSINLKIYRIFKALGVEIELLQNKHFMMRKKPDDELSYGCLNSMIYYLEINIYKQHIGYFINNNETDKIGQVGNYPVYKANENDYLFIDLQTIQDLKLTDDFFTKINFTKTIYGRNKLKKLILFPLKNKNEIIQRHNKISGLRNKNISIHLKKIKNTETNGMLDIFEVPSLIKNAINIGEHLKNTSLKFKNLDLFKNIYKFIDIFEGTDLKQGMFPKYDHLIYLYNNLPDYLNEIAQNIVKNTNINIYIIYLPQLGYLIETDKDQEIKDIEFNISINEDNANNKNKFCFSVTDTTKHNESNYKDFFESRVDEISHVIDNFTNQRSHSNAKEWKDSMEMSHLGKKRKSDQSYILNNENIEYIMNDNQLFNPEKSIKENINYSFIIKDKIYYKTNIMNLLDIELGDLNNLIQEYKNIKINEVRELIMKYSLDSIYEYIGLVDCINSFNLFSLRYKCCVPIISDDRKIVLRNYLNYKFEVKFDKSVVYKGSNDVLRIIGEAIILCHIGSHIPSSFAEIYVFDKVFTSIDIKESIISDTSYFLACIKSIGRIVHHATEDSLGLIGDLGYGTGYYEGLSLFYSLHKNMTHVFLISSCTFIEIFNNHNQTKEMSNDEKKDKDIIQYNNMSTIYYNKSESNECINCLCQLYDFYLISNDKEYFIINKIDKLEANPENFINMLDISDKIKKMLLENLEIIRNREYNDICRDDKWAIKIIRDFMRDNKDV
jgi:DNA mismatch repair ATPase MutS